MVKLKLEGKDWIEMPKGDKTTDMYISGLSYQLLCEWKRLIRDDRDIFFIKSRRAAHARF